MVKGKKLSNFSMYVSIKKKNKKIFPLHYLETQAFRIEDFIIGR